MGLSPEPVTAQGEAEVHFINVGNADCTLIRQGEAAVLIDAGERGDKGTIISYLRSQGVDRLNLVVATHAHADHIGSMAAVIREFPVDKFLFAPMPEKATPTSATYLDMLEALDEKKVPVEKAVPGTVYPVGTAQLQVIAPLTECDDMNNMSVVTRLTFGDRSFLFTGDIEEAVEEELVGSRFDLSADVLKTPHHGSDTSSTPAFIKAVHPRYALIPCGLNNRYGHPDKKVLELYKKQDITFYCSDVYGHVVFTTDGKELQVTTEKS